MMTASMTLTPLLTVAFMVSLSFLLP